VALTRRIEPENGFLERDDTIQRIGAQRRKTAEGSPQGERQRVNLQERLWLVFDVAQIISIISNYKQLILCVLCDLCG
jgi:hypothetical protein